jgi:signal transduction histidine kinase
VSATMSSARVRSRLPRQSHGPAPSVGVVRAVILAVIFLDVAVLALGAAFTGRELLDSWLDLVLWTLAAAAVGVAAIQSPSGQLLGMDMPLLLAVGYLFGPLAGGIVAFAGYIDIREFRGEISFERALFNRAQTSLSVVAAATVFSAISSGVNILPAAAFGALLAVAVDCLVNYGMVAGLMALKEHVPPMVALSRLRLGSVLEFVGIYAAFGLSSLVLAEVYLAVGAWGLVLFAMPILLAREAFSQGQSLEGARTRLSIQGRALQHATDRIADERRDERLAIASGLHDDVLPPLFKVHLMGQVLRQELSTGQLLAMEDDLPELLRATDEASGTLRSVIRSLRASPLGAGGLAHTLQLLIRQLESESHVSLRAELEEVKATPVVELLAYQAAREALRNALRHSGASRINVTLSREGDDIRLQVEDDGEGFSPSSVDQEQHFGLALMRERLELAGGILQVDSSPGMGTRVFARLPSVDPERA